MISTSQKYKQELIAGNRRFVVKAYVTLSDNTQLTLTNQELWEQGVVISNGISNEDSFDIGTAIIGKLTLTIDNINGTYNAYDFSGADVVLWMGVENDVDLGGNQVYYRIGFYVVDDTSYNGSLITLSCLDNMTWFDVPFSEVTGVTYPTTAGTLVQKICNHIGVTLGVAHFQNYTMVIPNAPEGENNCRDVLQYVAQKCCCYCKINTAGQLILTWYDKNAIIGLTNYDGGTYNTTTTPYSDGCNLDGGQWYWDGSTYVWTQGDNADGGTFQELQQQAWLTQNYDMSVSTDEIVVTGCRVRSTVKDNEYDELWVDSTIEQTHPRYVLVIENNPFITTSDAATTANTIGNILKGLPIRAFTARSASDFSYETGDMVTIMDFRGNLYHTWITNLTFTINNSESFSCGAESIKQRRETRFSGTVKTLVEAQIKAEEMLTAYDNAVKAMNTLAQNAIGYREYYYPSEATALDSRVTYRYNGTTRDTTLPNKPKFPNSTVVFKISGDGVFVSTSKDSQGYPIYTNGYDANSGTAILNLLYAQGLNAKWITAGTVDTARLNVSGIVNGINSGTTTIDGGKITADTITATQIASDTITATQIASSTITANELNVTSLDAITANMGQLTVNDDITIDSGGSIGIHASANMNAAYISNGDFSIDVSRNSSSWGGLYFGKSVYEYTDHDFGKTCCTLWAGGDSSGGYHVLLGAPSEGNSGNFTAMKFNVFQVWVGGDLKAWLDESGVDTDSDRRRKKNIKTLAIDKVRQFFKNVRPTSFKYKKDEDNLTHYGIVAQEVESALKDSGFESDSVVKTAKGAGDTLFVNYQEFHGIELAAIKDLYEIVQKQQAEIEELKARIK